jgi:hypothetical protein
MKKYFSIVILIVSSVAFTNAQPYEQVIKEDSTVFYFVQSQLAGSFVDTIRAGEKVGDAIGIWYTGEFVNRERTYAGSIRTNDDNSKLWYVNDETETLIFDLTLEKGDTFSYPGESVIVDSVYYNDGRKIIEFNKVTNFDEPLKFIEGCGPNNTILCEWKDPYLSFPLLMCQFTLDELVYSISNSYFVNCELNTISVNKIKLSEIAIFPNPFNSHLQIKALHIDNNILTEVRIFSHEGRLVHQEFVMFYGEEILDLSDLCPGIYFISLISDRFRMNNKVIKL